MVLPLMSLCQGFRGIQYPLRQQPSLFLTPSFLDPKETFVRVATPPAAAISHGHLLISTPKPISNDGTRAD